MPIKNLCPNQSGTLPDCFQRLPEFVLVRHVIRIINMIAIVGMASLVGACCSTDSTSDVRPREKAPDTKSECPGPELPEATVRSIGFAVVRNEDPNLPPTPPNNIRVTRYECNYLYTEVFSPETVGGYITVVISPDGRVLDVLPSL